MLMTMAPDQADDLSGHSVFGLKRMAIAARARATGAWLATSNMRFDVIGNVGH
jgi:hypothetical protein